MLGRHSEAADFLYRNNTFLFTSANAFISFHNLASTGHLQRLRDLRLELAYISQQPTRYRPHRNAVCFNAKSWKLCCRHLSGLPNLHSLHMMLNLTPDCYVHPGTVHWPFATKGLMAPDFAAEILEPLKAVSKTQACVLRYFAPVDLFSTEDCKVLGLQRIKDEPVGRYSTEYLHMVNDGSDGLQIQAHIAGELAARLATTRSHNDDEEDERAIEELLDRMQHEA